MKINLSFISINNTEIPQKEILESLKKNFSENSPLKISFLDESIQIPTDQERAAPWHFCPVTEELEGIKSKRCYSLNYCLMYIIDKIETLNEEYPNTDYFVMLFPKSPTRSGGFVLPNKKCICVKNNISKIIEKLNSIC